MSELDKKPPKSQQDLAQSVLEAMEKRNVERVDMLITNAFKQLKMSRFKPDLAICVGLTYLARTCPKAYSQSMNLKELLKTHIKRDNAPSNIKGTKSDYILPVLSANILLACCDSADVRSIILTRVEQWIGTNQKLNELVQHLLAVLCVRSHDDPQTIKTLIDIRSQWFQYMESNFDTYGQVSCDLSRSIRNLLINETCCESLMENLSFLAKHDSDVEGLTASISELIIRKPFTINDMLNHPELGEQLQLMLMSFYEKLFKQFKFLIKKNDLSSAVFIRVTPHIEPVALNRTILEALLIVISSEKIDQILVNSEHVLSWLNEQLTSNFTGLAYDDVTMTRPIEFPLRILQQMISTNGIQVDLALKCATPAQIVDLAQQFGLEQATLNKIFCRLDSLDPEIISKSGIKELTYFQELMELYSEMGVEGVEKLCFSKGSL